MKFFCVCFGVFFLMRMSVTAASAALLKVDVQGYLVWNVLSLETDIADRESLKVVNLAQNQDPHANSIISLSRDNGKVELRVETGENSVTTDVTNYKEEIVEVEERESVKKLTIINRLGDFLIKQQDISALTSFPITIDASKKELLVETPTGKRLIKVLPKEAFDDLTKAHLIDNLVDPNVAINLVENEEGELHYFLDGERQLNLLNLVDLRAPVKVSVSATSGEVLHIDQPTWLRIFGFLFT